MATQALQELTDAGVSIWLDDLSRSRLTTGSLAGLVATHCVRGVTSNPSIFEAAISKGAADYAADLENRARQGLDVDLIIQQLTTDDVRAACDVLLSDYQASGGVDGRVSIEVDPRLAHDTHATVEQARLLWALIDRPNLLIKIPATLAGLPAITQTIGHGISVNVTLIFSVQRYDAVITAYEEGLSLAAKHGHDLAGIHSVASFFVSRVDTDVDRQLDALGTPHAMALRGKAAIANARLAYERFQERLDLDAWALLAAKGARPQRPLWASTGVKDPAYDDTRYVIDLAVRGTVNTMPQATMDAVADHGVFAGDQVSGRAAESAEVWAALSALGIQQQEVCDALELEGVQKFIDAWEQLRATVQAAMDAIV
ncbi:MAG: transaldolase [Candidatus Nanopelagicales bacterium]|nr:transaldolase [Candidatus Nanopelagicales bacterium]